MLGIPLDFNPGERYAYSNFGYCLLGRIIEKTTGKNYETYVKEYVFAPLGIRTARIGKTHIGPDTPAEEVRYYTPDLERNVFSEDPDKKVPSAYGGWFLEAMDSHGAWTASAVDLVRLASAFDKPEKCRILKPESIGQMFARPEGLAKYGIPGDPKAFYSLGWINKPSTASDATDNWHFGSLPGTASLLMRRHDGRTFAILFNARSSPSAEHFGKAIKDAISRALDGIRNWPEIDLFEYN
jgi:N-acyl-D-amino-acid deacylase